MKAVVIVPARLGSSRLPRKVLADICGKPMLWYVYQQASRARNIEKVYVATDSPEICRIVSEWGGEYFLTEQNVPSGTARIASIVDQIKADIIVNVQGDEPLVNPMVIDKVVDAFDHVDADIVTPVFQIDNTDTLFSEDAIKVVRDVNGFALYFSRSPIPFVRDVPHEKWINNNSFWGHVGIYGYRREVLKKYQKQAKSILENAEKLEQLRFLEAGISIFVVETNYQTVSVDTSNDLEQVRKIISDKNNNYSYSIKNED